MTSSLQPLRNAIEDSLARRVPWALKPVSQAAGEVIATRIATIDELLAGGLPVGALTEIVGSLCSGRTVCAHAFVSQVTRQGQVCAWIDGSDCFDAESAAANGTDLERLLWVRCGGEETGSVVALPPIDVAPASAANSMPVSSGGSLHPRNEVRGMPEAINAFMSDQKAVRSKKIGTPGMSNRSLSLSRRTEQVATDRLPARRGEHLLKNRARFEPLCAAPQRKERPKGRRSAEGCSPPVAGMERGATSYRQSHPCHRLDQALRVTDLLMQAGGFGAIVLDLGSIAPEFVSRVPLATWFRFRAAADRARTSILLLTQHPCAQSSAEVVLRTRAAMPDAGTVMTSLPFTVEIVRQRFRPASSNVVPLRKPPQRTDVGQWSAPASWVGGR